MKNVIAIAFLLCSTLVFSQRQRTYISIPAPKGDTITLAVGEGFTYEGKDMSYKSFIDVIEYTQELLALQDTVISMESVEIYDIEFVKDMYEELSTSELIESIIWRIYEDKDGRSIGVGISFDKEGFSTHVWATKWRKPY